MTSKERFGDGIAVPWYANAGLLVRPRAANEPTTRRRSAPGAARSAAALVVSGRPTWAHPAAADPAGWAGAGTWPGRRSQPDRQQLPLRPGPRPRIPRGRASWRGGPPACPGGRGGLFYPARSWSTQRRRSCTFPRSRVRPPPLECFRSPPTRSARRTLGSSWGGVPPASSWPGGRYDPGAASAARAGRCQHGCGS